jgi:hypothetical protein
MTPWNQWPKAPSACGLDDANVAAFVEVTSIIGSRDAVEEFLACGLWPLSEKFGIEVETKETPCQKLWYRCHWSPPLLGRKSLRLCSRRHRECHEFAVWQL